MPRSEYVYIIGYETPDFMGAWTVKKEMLNFLRNNERCDYAFLKNCWVARLKDSDPGYFESMHEDSDILVIQEAKRIAEGIDPEPGEVLPE